MKLQTIIFLVTLVVVGWQLLTFRKPHLKSRVARALRVATVAYLAVIAARLVTSPIEQDQLEIAGLTLAFFGVVWGVVWLVTRSATSRR